MEVEGCEGDFGINLRLGFPLFVVLDESQATQAFVHAFIITVFRCWLTDDSERLTSASQSLTAHTVLQIVVDRDAGIDEFDAGRVAVDVNQPPDIFSLFFDSDWKGAFFLAIDGKVDESDSAGSREVVGEDGVSRRKSFRKSFGPRSSRLLVRHVGTDVLGEV